MKISTAVSVLFFIAVCHPALGEELANVFGSEEQEALSREASAEALSAIELAISALRARELGESSGIEQLAVASANLFNAISKMRSLLDFGLDDFEFSVEQQAFLQNRIGDAVDRYDGLFSGVDTFGELFSAYIVLGDVLASALKSAATPGEGRSALSYFATELSDFITIGDAITAIGKSQLQ